MRRRAIGLILSSILVPGALSAQDGRVQLAVHGGINGGPTAVVGAQAAVRLSKGVRLGFTGVQVLGLRPAEESTIRDASIGFTPWTGTVRPSFLLGVAWVHESDRANKRDESGVGVGVGIEAGRGAIRPFIDTRLVRVNRIFSRSEGTNYGWLTAGFRLHLGP